MRTTLLGTTALLTLSLALGCNNGSTSTPADMPAPTGDMAVTIPPDLAVTIPPDLTQLPPDMTTVFHGCDDVSFMDLSAAGANRTVTFGTAGNTYSPKCILINAGQTVTFNGNFSSHPMRAGTVSGQMAGTAGSPIMPTNNGTSAQFTFANVGTFPYICTVHGSGGMVGVVRVK